MFAADGPMGPNDAYAVDNEINVAAGISAMEITTNAGTEFTFEFIDEDNSEDRTDGDQYTSAAMNDGNEVFTLSMNEALFEDGLDITNGDSIRVNITEEGYTTPGTPATTTVTPIDVTTAAWSGQIQAPSLVRWGITARAGCLINLVHLPIAERSVIGLPCRSRCTCGWRWLIDNMVLSYWALNKMRFWIR